VAPSDKGLDAAQLQGRQEHARLVVEDKLVAGDRYDGAVVIGVDLIPYAGGATFDVLPAGATGAYWANGVLLGSTLR